MDRLERESRRDSFLAQATGYQAARPPYPDELLEAAVACGSLQAGDRLLEIGCGTGQATAWFGRYGFKVLALDRSAPMVHLARAALSGFPDVEVREVDFERDAPPSTFRGLVAATSFHWLDPGSRAQRCAHALEPGGALILLWHTHPPPFTGYFERVQPIYERFMPGWSPPPSPGMTEHRISAVVTELQETGLFRAVHRLATDWEQAYGRDEYLQLLSTYSDHRLLAPSTRSALFTMLSELIDVEFNGVVVKPYRSEAVIGIRRA